ncbi:MAG: glutamine synthetase [Ruminococcus sp.]|nr:glutamine synthetase [Ruminococcus sp.]
MKYTEKEVLQFVEENDVKFIKLMFCDIFGALKSVSVLASELPQIFRKGLLFDASKLSGFMNFSSTDLLLFPEPDTLALLPWRPQQGRVVRFFCTIKYTDGTVFEGDGRSFLKNAVEFARGKGYNFQIGTSCEFYVFEKNDNGHITKIPHDYAGYCDIAPADKGENLRRDICLTLEQMDIYPESSRHESGPGQNEIDFQYSNALNAADNLVTFKNVVKSVADRNGLYATFMPKPLCDRPGSGLHIMLLCMKGTENIFVPRAEDLGKEAKSMIAGILDHVKEITLFLNSTAGSYSRFGNLRAPKYITWSHENFAQLLRVPMNNNDENAIILRSPDNTCNPYFALGLVIYAALEGALQNYSLCPPTDLRDDDIAAVTDKLPASLEEAIEAARNSSFLSERLPENLLEHVLMEKTQEAKEYAACEDKDMFETIRYFYTL